MTSQQLLDVSTKLCDNLQKCGAETYRVEDTVERILAAHNASEINVFVINLQLKVLLGLVSIWLLVPTFANFFDRMTILIFDQIHGIMGV